MISFRPISSEKTTVGMLFLIAAERAKSLQRENHGRHVVPDRGRAREVKRERALADGGAGRDDHHLARVQAVGQGVQVGEAGGDAADAAAVGADRLDLLEGLRHDLRQRVVVLGDPPVGDRVHLGLGAVDEFVGVAVPGVAELDDPRARLHEPPQDRAFPDDPRVVAGVRRGGHRRDQRVQVRGPADAGQLAAPGELVGDRDRVGGLAPRVQVEDRLVHELVRRAVVIAGPDDLDHVGDGVLGQQHAAKDALLGGDVVRWHPLEFLAALWQLGNAHQTPPPHA